MSEGLTPEEMEAMPANSAVYDRDGSKMTKDSNGYWSYWPGVTLGVPNPTMWSPYSLIPPVDPADPDYNPKRDARR